ncbi:hypothetical protein [Rheinheimera sp. WS51]|uniref:hypothetical protein n=1 Tax=Rheinheimera sp. WS51 TaxID=3425886 RepID=UPI003D8E1360
MLKSKRPLFLVSLLSLVSSPATLAEQLPLATVNLLAHSHVCNLETEVARLAENEQLQEMARALVEFKATKYCFILTPDSHVQILETYPTYVKFKYKTQTLYTFNKYLSAPQEEPEMAQVD